MTGWLRKIRPDQTLDGLNVCDLFVLTLLFSVPFFFPRSDLWLFLSAQTGAALAEGGIQPADPVLQLLSLVLAAAYLLLRHFDFGKIPLRLGWSVLLWAIVLFVGAGLLGDLAMTLSGEYNYFDPVLWQQFAPLAFFRKLAELTPGALPDSLLFACYQECFLLGFLGAVRREQRWLALGLSILARAALSYSQGWIWMLTAGLLGGMFYLLYRHRINNLLPFILASSLSQLLGSSFIYLLMDWH